MLPLGENIGAAKGKPVVRPGRKARSFADFGPDNGREGIVRLPARTTGGLILLTPAAGTQSESPHATWCGRDASGTARPRSRASKS